MTFLPWDLLQLPVSIKDGITVSKHDVAWPLFRAPWRSIGYAPSQSSHGIFFYDKSNEPNGIIERLLTYSLNFKNYIDIRLLSEDDSSLLPGVKLAEEKIKRKEQEFYKSIIFPASDSNLETILTEILTLRREIIKLMNDNKISEPTQRKLTLFILDITESMAAELKRSNKLQGMLRELLVNSHSTRIHFMLLSSINNFFSLQWIREGLFDFEVYAGSRGMKLGKKIHPDYWILPASTYHETKYLVTGNYMEADKSKKFGSSFSEDVGRYVKNEGRGFAQAYDYADAYSEKRKQERLDLKNNSKNKEDNYDFFLESLGSN